MALACARERTAPLIRDVPSSSNSRKIDLRFFELEYFRISNKFKYADFYTYLSLSLDPKGEYCKLPPRLSGIFFNI